MIQRPTYLQQLIEARKNGFPKVVTGIRRCGKSYLLSTIYAQYLRSRGVPNDSIIMLSLDDDRNIAYRDPLTLGDHIRALCAGKKDCYVFIDEIQLAYTIKNPLFTEGKHVLTTLDDPEAISFVSTVLGLSREPNIDLYVTGFNSKMLASDIITEFRDKATNIHLSPLSFPEFHAYSKASEQEDLFSYMEYGGMPLAVLQDTEEKKRQYLQSLFETTYFRDIVERNHLRRTEDMEELCNIISASTGEFLNTKKISDTFQSVCKKKTTPYFIDTYLGYFKDSFLLREATRYDLKGRKAIGALRKYYFTDTGLRNARLNFAFPDRGQVLENIIYNELLFHGYNVTIGSFDTIEKDDEGKSVRKGHEVDFFARNGIRSLYIQVCLDMADQKTRTRETRPFLLLHDQVQKIVVVDAPVKETLDEHGFTIIGATDFLLRFLA